MKLIKTTIISQQAGITRGKFYFSNEKEPDLTLAQLQAWMEDHIANMKFQVVREAETGKWRTTMSDGKPAELGGIFWTPNKFIPILVTFKDKWQKLHTGYLDGVSLGPDKKVYPSIRVIDGAYMGIPGLHQVNWKDLPPELRSLLPQKY